MDMKSKMTNIFLMFLIFMTLSSCNSQGKIDTYPTALVQKTIGQTVRTLAPNANLIYQDNKNSYWFGNDIGIYRFNGKGLILFTIKDGLISNRVLGVQEDEFGNVYFDTPEGVSKFDGQRFTTLTVIENSAEKNHWKLEPTDLWFRIGWEHNGPFRYDGEHLHPLEFPKNNIEDEFYQKNPSVSYNPYGIFSMFKDSKGNIWFGTSDLGIYRFDGIQISWMYEEHLGTVPEGGNFGIRSITEDKDGFFWICNTNYKYKILPDSIVNTELQAINYTREKAIAKDQKDAQYFMGMVPDNNGNLWMINDDGVWQNNGKELTQFYIKDDGVEISPRSIFKDNQGTLWFGTRKNGIYKYNGKEFEKFKI